MNPKQNPPEVCPVCGNDVPRKAKACPECGADHRSGWREDAAADGIDSGDDEFNYEEFVASEFNESAKPPGLKPVWWITGIVILLALIATSILSMLKW